MTTHTTCNTTAATDRGTSDAHNVDLTDLDSIDVYDVEYAPLSGEWAGESIPELFGDDTPTDDQLDTYDQAATTAFYRTLTARLTATVRDTLNSLNACQLAYHADCATPDSDTSNGAAYLYRVRDAIVESLTYAIEHNDTYDNDDIHQQIDGTVPIYTHAMWATFVDLAAYNVDVTDYGTDDSNTDSRAAVALYVIGETLAAALLDIVGVQS